MTSTLPQRENTCSILGGEENEDVTQFSHNRRSSDSITWNNSFALERNNATTSIRNWHFGITVMFGIDTARTFLSFVSYQW